MTQVFVISNKNLTSIEPIALGGTPNDDRKNKLHEIKQISLEDEKHLYQKKANKREEVFMRIITNKRVNFSSVSEMTQNRIQSKS